MESIFEKIKEVFPENEGYIIEIEKVPDNNYVIFITKDNVSYPKKKCLEVVVLKEHMILNTLSKCGDKSSGNESSGNILLEKIDKLAELLGIKEIELNDMSNIFLNGIEINLTFFKILSTGQSWYNNHGYVSDEYKDEKIKNDKLRRRNLINELDLNKEKIVNKFNETGEFLIPIRRSGQESKNEMVIKIKDKIDKLKEKIFKIELNNNDLNDNIITRKRKFDDIKDKTIGEFFESIILDNLTPDQTEILQELIEVIGVSILYNINLKKTIVNSNNTKKCSSTTDRTHIKCKMMGGGKTKNKKQTKNNQNETREYGTWKDGSSVYKDKNGYFIYSIRYDDDENSKGEEYKKYLKNWKPTGILYLDESKGGPGKWSSKKPIVDKKNKTLKYKNRPSPPYPANDWCGKNKKGNDGNIYTSKKNKNGVCRWVKV